MKLLAVLLLTNFVCQGSLYNILAIFPLKSKSHYAIIDPLMVRLAELGHNVTIYDPFPKKKQMCSNYKEVDISECFVLDEESARIETMLSMTSTRYTNLMILFMLGANIFTSDSIEKCPSLKLLLNSTEKYDLLITESFVSDMMLLFANKFQIPVITFIPNTLLPWLSNRMGNPDNPSYIPHMISGHSSKMSFVERIHNTLLYLISVVYYHQVTLKNDDEINKHYLGYSVPSLYDTVKNTSILFINANECLNPVIPLVPGIVSVAGIHIKSAAPLPENIEKFINESTHGVVYFCMGSLLRGETFPAEKRDAFLYAFSKIPQRVLWKWEGDVLPGKSENIMTSKWMPQRDILAHPNVKLFISHGGLLGTSEAVYEGVPVIGIPIFGDQRTNVKALEANGAGELLDYNDISGEVVLEKIQRLLNDPKYKENARQLSIRYKDRPMSPLDTAVYWTEYVIRHKGAPHLKTAAVDMPWYQYLLLDVIAFLIFILVSVILIIYYSVKISLRYLCALIFGNSSSLKPTKKVKDN